MSCAICGDDLNKSEIVLVKEKGIRTFIKFSELSLLCFFCTIDLREEKDVRVISNDKTKETIIKAISKTQCNRNEAIFKRIENVDLKKEQARYHRKCYLDCLRPRKGLKRGRPEDHNVTAAMETIYLYMEETSDTQFTLSELKALLSDYIPDNRTILGKLQKRYGSKISITEQSEDAIISFNVYEDQENASEENSLENLNLEFFNENELDEEKLSIIKKAAEILKDDVALKVFKGRGGHPSPQFFLTKAKHNVPGSLDLFLKTLAGDRASGDDIKIAAASNLLLVQRSI